MPVRLGPSLRETFRDPGGNANVEPGVQFSDFYGNHFVELLFGHRPFAPACLPLRPFPPEIVQAEIHGPEDDVQHLQHYVIMGSHLGDVLRFQENVRLRKFGRLPQSMDETLELLDRFPRRGERVETSTVPESRRKPEGVPG